MTDERNYHREREELVPLTDSILDVWTTHFGALKRAAIEIRFSRFWLERMDSDRRAAEAALAESLRREAELSAVLRDIRTTLWSSNDRETMVEIDEKIKDIL